MNKKRIGNLQTQALSRDLSIFFLSSTSRIRSIHQLIKRLMSRSKLEEWEKVSLSIQPMSKRLMKKLLLWTISIALLSSLRDFS